MEEISGTSYSWYLDITPNQMFSLEGYPIEGKRGLPHCGKHGNILERNEVVLFDGKAAGAFPPDHCWLCENLLPVFRQM
jgi:hypothetical protein